MEYKQTKMLVDALQKVSGALGFIAVTILIHGCESYFALLIAN